MRIFLIKYVLKLGDSSPRGTKMISEDIPDAILTGRIQEYLSKRGSCDCQFDCTRVKPPGVK